MGDVRDSNYHWAWVQMGRVTGQNLRTDGGAVTTGTMLIRLGGYVW